METAILLLIALSVLHYAVVFYSTLAKKMIGFLLRLEGRRDAIARTNPSEWPPKL